MNPGAGQSPYKLGRDTFAVRIENIAPCVGRHEIIELFSNLIGHVRKCDESMVGDHGRYMDISFFSRDASRKALCMSGYTVAGVPLSVTALAPPRNHNYASRVNGQDDRRNLYVLGLPFNLTKTEFSDLFSQYGTVAHSVILATVDNASRRRGFIVMSTHQEAKEAMDGLSRAEIKGHVIDVSWAVVQRSQGFLDGGDRQLTLSTRDLSPGRHADTRNSPEPRLSPLGRTFPARATGLIPSPHSSTSSIGSQLSLPGLSSLSTIASSGSLDADYGRYGDVGSAFGAPTRPGSRAGIPELLYEDRVARLVGPKPSAVLLVRDLPALLFEADADLAPLFWPYGDVVRLERLKVASAPPPNVPTTGMSTTPSGSPPQSATGLSSLSSSVSGTFSFNPSSPLDTSGSSLKPPVAGLAETDITPPSANNVSAYPGSLSSSRPGTAGSGKEATRKPASASMSILVEYSSISSAREARQSLHGQVYGTHTVTVDFVELPSPRGMSPSRGSPLRETGTYGTSFGPSTLPYGGPGLGSSMLDVREYSHAPFKRHSVGGLSSGPFLDVTPSSPPRSARAIGGFYERERERAFERGYPSRFDRDVSLQFDDPFARERFSRYDALVGGAGGEWERERELALQLEWEREREFAVRRAMYDRSNNTSPFPGRRGMLRPHPGPGYAAAFASKDSLGPIGGRPVSPLGCGDGENKFGAIARPSSSAARFPPEVPASALPKSKFDELRFAEYPPMGPSRAVGRTFQSMPDVFDYASGTSTPQTS